MKRFFVLVVLGFILSFTNSSHAFVIDVRSCPSFPSQSDIVYEFNFDEFAFNPDVTVQVSQESYANDISIAITDNPRLANLIMADDLDQADISICRSRISSYSSTEKVITVKVQRFAVNPDIKVRVTTNTRDAEYILFNRSEEFSDDEAAAFFAVLWKRGQRQQQPTMTAYQLQYRQGGKWVGGPIFRGRWECSDAKWAPGVIGARCVEVQVPLQ